MVKTVLQSVSNDDRKIRRMWCLKEAAGSWILLGKQH
jgi:hypothetical protein